MPNCTKRSFLSYTKPVLIVLLTLEIIIGITIIVSAEMCKRMLLQHKWPVGTEISSNFSDMLYLQFYGLHLIIHYAFGYVCVKHSLGHFKQGVELVVKMWHLFVVLVSLDGLVVYWVYIKTEPELIQVMKRAMISVMAKYFSDPASRYRWDKYQINQQCCGVRGYMDWLEKEWREVDDRFVDFVY